MDALSNLSSLVLPDPTVPAAQMRHDCIEQNRTPLHHSSFTSQPISPRLSPAAVLTVGSEQSGIWTWIGMERTQECHHFLLCRKEL